VVLAIGRSGQEDAMQKLIIIIIIALAACAAQPDPVADMLSERTQSVLSGDVDVDETCPIGPRGTCGTGGTPTSCVQDPPEFGGSAMCCTSLTPGLHVCCVALSGRTEAMCMVIPDEDCAGSPECQF
jgi:hypothetical protein